jgi:L-fuconolactonase
VDEPDENTLRGAGFLHGLSLLQHYHLTFDLLLHPKHLAAAVLVVERFPQQRFVVDHLAKPDIRAGRLSPWREDMAKLARHPNVFCKLSGMVTQADWQQWQPAHFQAYLNTALDLFGPHRLMIGSDWPVCTLAAGYREVMRLVEDFLASFSPAVQEAILGKNAADFYGLGQ